MINFILKENRDGGAITVDIGEYGEGDGQSVNVRVLDCPWVMTDLSAFLVNILIMSGLSGRSSTARVGGVRIKAIRSTKHSWGVVTQQGRTYRHQFSEQPMRVVTPLLLIPGTLRNLGVSQLLNLCVHFSMLAMM